MATIARTTDSPGSDTDLQIELQEFLDATVDELGVPGAPPSGSRTAAWTPSPPPGSPA